MPHWQAQHFCRYQPIPYRDQELNNLKQLKINLVNIYQKAFSFNELSLRAFFFMFPWGPRTFCSHFLWPSGMTVMASWEVYLNQGCYKRSGSEIALLTASHWRTRLSLSPELKRNYEIYVHFSLKLNFKIHYQMIILIRIYRLFNFMYQKHISLCFTNFKDVWDLT